MHCELVVPGLLAAAEGRYRAIETLFARGRRTIEQPAPQRLEPWLQEAFDLGEGGFPAGALSLIAANGDPGDESWLRADPVHLQLARDHAIVVPAEALSISRAEANALCASLNGHFGGSFEVHPLDPRRWYARLRGPPVMPEAALDDVPALQVAGREVPLVRSRDLEVGEMQMLLHAHPVNEAREARGELPVNSLWLWGAGRARKATSKWRSVLADEPLAMGLAMLARTRYRSLPVSALPWLEQAPEEGRHLIVLDALRAPVALGDVAAYRESMAALEAAWFAPLLLALRAGRLGMLTVHVPDADEALSLETIRGDLRRFWRRPKPLGTPA